MRVAVYIPLIASLIFAIGWPRLAVRLTSPAVGAWTLTVGAALSAAGTIWSLTLLSGTLTDDVLPAPYSRIGAAIPPAPVNDVVGLAAAALLAAGVGRLVVNLRREYRVHRELHRLCAQRPTGMVVLADPAPQAFAVPGHGGHIVVSSGMLAALDGPQRRVLIAHEQAHLACRHHWHTGIVRAAATLTPWLVPVGSASRYLCERWADETAASAVGDRRLAASSLATAALATAALAPVGVPNPPTALAYHGAGIGARVAALQAPPAGPRHGVLRGVLAIGLAGLLALLVAADVHATGDFFRAMLPFLREL